MKQQSWYAHLGLFDRFEVGVLSQPSESVTFTEATPANDGKVNQEDSLSMSEGIGGVSNFRFSENLALEEYSDARIRGVLQTVFITDERFLSAILPKPVRSNPNQTENKRSDQLISPYDKS